MGEGQLVSRARGAANRQDGSDWLDVAARVGLAAYGVVHLVIAWLAVQLAFGDRAGSASSSGAVNELAQQPFGQVLVWAVAVGMLLLVVWQGIEAISGHRDEDGATRTGKRLLSVGKAIVYGAIGLSAFRVATGSGSSGQKSEEQTDSLTARLMDLPAGQLVVAAVGLVIVGIGTLARRYRRGFPSSLQGAPFLLPDAGGVLRRQLERWFSDLNLSPRVCGEFADNAMMKIAGVSGLGLLAVPGIIEDDVRRIYGLHRVGVAVGVHEQFYAVSVERRIKHSGVLAIREQAKLGVSHPL